MDKNRRRAEKRRRFSIGAACAFAAANAEAFARGAVRLLTESGIVDTLAFGSESGNLQELQEAAKILANETEEFQRLLKELLGEGLSYPAARTKFW